MDAWVSNGMLTRDTHTHSYFPYACVTPLLIFSLFHIEEGRRDHSTVPSFLELFLLLLCSSVVLELEPRASHVADKTQDCVKSWI